MLHTPFFKAWRVRLAPMGGDGVGGYAKINCGRFTDLIVSTNGGSGLVVGFNCLISDCVAYANVNNGIEAQAGSVIANCSASYNGGIGFRGPHLVCRDSIASYNGGSGIYIYNSSRALHCDSQYNAKDGIALGIGCHALGNTCTYNNPSGSSEYAGIRTFYSGGHIEGNFVKYSAGMGIFINTNTTAKSSGWTVIKNSTQGLVGTAYIYPTGNDIGPIGDAATSTSPWANLRR
ncbi:MAG TPA: right-handed parallel beta-helix repeat-containing protein [Clostridia bacterium]|nr:right-handed parallel beta-helix repeat-containing protein [Clostridia bacterium]